MFLEKFLFCCKLHNGAFVWGILSILFYAALLISTTMTKIKQSEEVNSYGYGGYNKQSEKVNNYGYGDYSQESEEVNTYGYDDYNGNRLGSGDSYDEYGNYGYDNNYMFSYKTWQTISIVSLAIHLISSVSLTIGAQKRNHFLMLPWIICNGITLFPFALLVFVLLIFTLPLYGPIYIWWCICSTYQKAKADRAHRAVPYKNLVSPTSLEYPHEEKKIKLDA